MKEQQVYIGNISKKGIYSYKFVKGKLIKKYETNDFEKCTYLANNRTYIYSVIETSDINNDGNGYIISYKKCKDRLINIDKKSSYGKGPCHIELSKNNNMIFISNYIDGYLSIIKVNKDGTLGEKIYSFVENENKSHLHCVKKSLKGENFFLSDLGENLIIAYEIKKQKIEEVSRLKLKIGTEPRHIAVSKDKIYVVTEKSCEIYILEFKNKALKLLDVVSILPNNVKKKENYTGSAIKISKDFKYIYVSVRGHNSVSIFKINQKTIKMIQNTSCMGNIPRDLEIDKSGKYILVANQYSNDIAIFKRNKITGKIEYKRKEEMYSPTCIIVE